ncbi:DNA cytosine methyltransferase [Photobacterium sanguinicancri]|uniref:Cytosine-specific methyltransferase n=1 Tax=Photobacterium sanguinicancri TaxID=875932 RepID=A0AAW7Y7I5_9GAMM|nr:DNA cytosine methyltransferase [Photobacterium sanguinicancri]MDO6542957.1 DNA cytosine methyltransferase [Photobacterium sanguinicancri]
MKAIDLFAGAGGFSLAARECGVDVIAAIELDSAASETYRKNLVRNAKQKPHLIEGDINQVNIDDLMAEVGIKSRELDLLLGGPPCQGFSTHRINGAGVDDPRNDLLLRYYEFVEKLNPKMFLIENVAGLLWKRHADYLETFLELAEEHGYKIHFCDILNARDYGVPQGRKRVFILGIRHDIEVEDLVFPPKPTHFSPTSGKSPQWRTTSCVFEKLTDELIEQYIEDYFRPKTKLTDEQARELLRSLDHGEPVSEHDPCNFHMQPSEKMVARFVRTPLNGSRTDSGHTLKCHSNGYKGHKDVYGRVMIHLPSNTITTGCNNPSKGRFVHPWLHHGFTMRHAARFQTFPDSYEFCGTSTQQAKQIGNAVPRELGRILIKSICEKL